MSSIPRIVSKFYYGPLDGLEIEARLLPEGPLLTTECLEGPLFCHKYMSNTGGRLWFYAGTRPTELSEIEIFVGLSDEYFEFVFEGDENND